MRELTYEEMEQVDGGVAPAAAAMAIAVGAGVGGGFLTGGWQGALVAGLFAAPAAVFAGVAVAATGITSLAFGAFSVATSILGTHATNQVGQATSP